jgi:hypothetical protein
MFSIVPSHHTSVIILRLAAANRCTLRAHDSSGQLMVPEQIGLSLAIRITLWFVE